MPSVTHWLGKFSLLRGLAKSPSLSTPRILHPEEMFHRLIHGEFARSERSGHSCRVLLVYHTDAQEAPVPMEAAVVTKTITLLSASLRATDSIGWYRDGYIVGGLLSTLQPDSALDGCNPLTSRVMDRLRGAMSSIDDRFLQVRVLEPSELVAFENLQPVKRET